MTSKGFQNQNIIQVRFQIIKLPILQQVARFKYSSDNPPVRYLIEAIFFKSIISIMVFLITAKVNRSRLSVIPEKGNKYGIMAPRSLVRPAQ